MIFNSRIGISLVIVLLLCLPVYAVNFTGSIEKMTARNTSMIRPRSVASGTISDISKLKGSVYVIDRSSSPLTRTSLEIRFKGNISEYKDEPITIKEYTNLGHWFPPGVEAVPLPSNNVLLGTYVSIETSINIEWALLRMSYALDLPKNVLEDSLYIAGYDATNKRWVKLEETPEWASSAGVDTERDYVWANLTHFSVYGIMGKVGVLERAPPEVTPFPAENLKTWGLILVFLLLIAFFIRLMR